MPPKTFVINLDRATERLEAITSQLHTIGLSFDRIAAVDGRALDSDALERLAPDPKSRLQARRLTPGEIGCLASHRDAWRRLVDSRIPWGFILEDDAILGPKVTDALDVFAHQTVFDLVKLEGITHKARHNFGAEMVAGSPAIYLMETVSAGTAAYALTRPGAAKLLRITAPMNREVDRFIRSYGLTDLAVGEFRPFPARQDRAQSFISGARLSAPPAPLPDRLIRVLLKGRDSLARRVRCKYLLRGKPLVAVTMEGSSASVFGRAV